MRRAPRRPWPAVDLAARHRLVEHLLRVRLALLGRLDRDVLEHDIDAVARADVGDAGAHHPGAEHGHLLRGPLLVPSGREPPALIEFRSNQNAWIMFFATWPLARLTK